MRKTTLIGAMTMLSLTVHAQTPSEYKVAPWHGFSESAITYSLDDLTPNQLPVAIPIFDKYGMKASLNVITSWVKPEQWAALKAAADNGHEIASHTVTHPNLAEIPADKFETEIRDSKKTLEEKTGHEVITLVYPYCVTAHEEISANYYISARGCDGRIEKQTPDRMMFITSKGAGNQFHFETNVDFDKWVNSGAEAKGWCTFLIHGIDGDGGYSPITSENLDKHLMFVDANPDKFWVATFAQVSKYILERDAIKISETPQKKGISLSVSCNATSKVTTLDEPITISRTLPAGSKTASVKENGKKIESKVSDGKVIFDVVPGKSYEIRKK